MVLHNRLSQSFFCFMGMVSLIGCEQSGDLSEPDYGYFGRDAVIQVRIEMDEADWDALRFQSRDFYTEFGGDCREEPFQHPYTYFHASIDVDGESLPDIGIRKKGFIGSQSTEKPGFRINLDEYVEGASLFGTDNMTLNNSVSDPTLMRQCLAYDRFAAAGLPAPRCNFARVYVNDRDLGIYVQIEPVKKKFLRRHFGSDEGDLYEGTLSDFDRDWYKTFEPKTDETDANYGPILNVMETLEAGDGTLEDMLEAHFDLENTLTHLAMENIVGHMDGYAGRNRNNFFIYRDDASDKFHFVTWGVDWVMQTARLEQGLPTHSVLMRAILNDPTLSDALESRTRELLESHWVESEILAEIDAMEALLSTEIDMAKLDDEVDALRDYVYFLKPYLNDALPGEPGESQAIGCLRKQGDVSAEFETTWGSLGGDVTRTGEVDLTMDFVDDGIVNYVRAGVAAGYGEDGTPLLVTAALLNEQQGVMILPVVFFDPDVIEVGTTQPFGGRIGGRIFYTDASMQGQFFEFGSFAGGGLTFEELGMDNGATLKGEFSTSIFAWEEK